MREKAEGVLYAGLFLLLLFSFALLAIKITGAAEAVWLVYYKVYLVLAIAHIWYVFILLFIVDSQGAPSKQYAGEKIAVIVPVFGEDPALVESTIRSIQSADGNKDIFIVDDGSKNARLTLVLRNLAQKRGIVVGEFAKNQGKRAAIHAAVSELVQRHEYVVMVDSDTVLDRDALIRLVEPLKSPNVGATTGDVQLLNEHENSLTRMIGAYYWSALNIQRKAQSAFGMVPCCAGALSAYKSGLLKSVIQDFYEQTFLGQKCTYADDRHLANLVLRSGYNIHYVQGAVAYTHSPATYRQFIKQQLRWKRGFYQEAIVALTFMWRVKPILFIDILLWDIVMPLLSLGFVLLMGLYAFLDPLFFIIGVVPSLLLLLLVRHLPLLFYSPKRFIGLIQYVFFNQFVMIWVGLYAMFTLRKRAWSTR